MKTGGWEGGQIILISGVFIFSRPAKMKLVWGGGAASEAR